MSRSVTFHGNSPLFIWFWSKSAFISNISQMHWTDVKTMAKYSTAKWAAYFYIIHLLCIWFRKFQAFGVTTVEEMSSSKVLMTFTGLKWQTFTLWNCGESEKSWNFFFRLSRKIATVFLSSNISTKIMITIICQWKTTQLIGRMFWTKKHNWGNRFSQPC